MHATDDRDSSWLVSTKMHMHVCTHTPVYLTVSGRTHSQAAGMCVVVLLWQCRLSTTSMSTCVGSCGRCQQQASAAVHAADKLAPLCVLVLHTLAYMCTCIYMDFPQVLTLACVSTPAAAAIPQQHLHSGSAHWKGQNNHLLWKSLGSCHPVYQKQSLLLLCSAALAAHNLATDLHCILLAGLQHAANVLPSSGPITTNPADIDDRWVPLKRPPICFLHFHFSCFKSLPCHLPGFYFLFGMYTTMSEPEYIIQDDPTVRARVEVIE